MEREIRKTAIERYLKGEDPKSIYNDLHRSKNWFFKWLKRFQNGDHELVQRQIQSACESTKSINPVDKETDH